jgi:hypothetical protein
MSQPFNDPSRLEKVFNRLQLFESEFKYNSIDEFSNNNSVDPFSTQHNLKLKPFYLTPIVSSIKKFTEDYIKASQLLHYGSTAYNFFIKGHKLPYEPVINYEVYTDEDPDRYYLELLDLLVKKFSKKAIFKIVPRIMYWKDIDADNYDIMFRLPDTRFKHLITFTKSYECMPYVQYNKHRYASFDRIKYNYYRGASLPDIVQMSQSIPRNYKYLLGNLLDIEKKLKKIHNTEILDGKYKPFRKECIGSEVNKLIGNLMTNFGKILGFLKKQNYMLMPLKMVC